MEYFEGDQVKLKAFGGKIIKRRIISVFQNIVLICRESEYQAAKKQRRRPVCVGFPKTDIVEDDHL